MRARWATDGDEDKGSCWWWWSWPEIASTYTPAVVGDIEVENARTMLRGKSSGAHNIPSTAATEGRSRTHSTSPSAWTESPIHRRIRHIPLPPSALSARTQREHRYVLEWCECECYFEADVGWQYLLLARAFLIRLVIVLMFRRLLLLRRPRSAGQDADAEPPHAAACKIGVTIRYQIHSGKLGVSTPPTLPLSPIVFTTYYQHNRPQHA